MNILNDATIHANHGVNIQRELNSLSKELGLDLFSQVDVISDASFVTLMKRSELVFSIKTQLNEHRVECECGLPFRIRLKAVLQILVKGLPEAFPGVVWEVCAHDGTPPLPLTVENIERIYTTRASVFVSGDTFGEHVESVRFGIRATP